MNFDLPRMLVEELLETSAAFRKFIIEKLDQSQQANVASIVRELVLNKRDKIPAIRAVRQYVQNNNNCAVVKHSFPTLRIDSSKSDYIGLADAKRLVEHLLNY